MGQNFSWIEQAWSTKSTTTTSRIPLRRRRQHLRWKRMYLLLQVDQRLKQKQENQPLLAHLQELYTFVKEYGLILNQELNPIKRTQLQQDWTLFFGMDNYLEKKMDRILEIKRLSSERIWALSMLVWWNVEEQNGRRRRQQENISILYWFFRTRNSSSPSSSRSFRTQSHWSFTTGKCANSGQSRRMCNQFTLHHKFRIDSGRTKFKQGKTDGILYGCESHGEGSQRSVWARLHETTSYIVQAENVEKTPRHGVFGRYTACSTKRIEVLSNKM